MRSSSRASSPARVGVVVDAQVDGDVVEAAVPGPVADHEQRRGLPAAPVAAGLVAGLQRGQQPPGERRSSGLLASQASSIASTTSGPTRMLPWIA